MAGAASAVGADGVRAIKENASAEPARSLRVRIRLPSDAVVDDPA
jgi:hypothetical protein